MRYFRKNLLCAAVLIAVSATASGASNFTVVATSGSQTTTLNFDVAINALDSIKIQNLSSSLPSYTSTSIASMDMNYRGLPIQLAYPTTGTQLVFSIPSLGISQQWTGTTRDDSQAQFVDFMKTGNVLGMIQKKLAEVSPIDPTAGNPNSLMSQMVTNDFTNAFSSTASSIAPQPNEKMDSNNLIGVGLRFSQYQQGGYQSRNITLPLSYTIRSDIDPRRQLVISLPISQTSVNGANSFYVGSGLAYRFPMNDNWTLTPSVGYAVTGSTDLGSAAQVASGSLTSVYVFNRTGYDIAIGNMIGIYKTLQFHVGGYSYNPDIQNTVFRNGAMLSTPVTVGGKKMSLEYALIDTRFTGTKLYMNSYDELSVTLGTNKNAQSSRSYMRAGASYLFSPQSHGLTLNFGYWF